MAFPFPFIIAEQTGNRRLIQLRGRSLPYRPVAWGERQRVNFNWFPGNPVASAQVIGVEFKPTTITGKWKDIFLFDDVNAATILNFPPLSPAAIPTPGVAAGSPPIGGTIDSAAASTLTAGPQGGQTFESSQSIPGLEQRARRARTLRDCFREVGKAGQIVRVEWGSVVRFGFLTEWDFPHDREEDIEFTLRFEWLGEKPAQDPIFVKPKLDLLGILARLLALLDEILNTFLKLLALINDKLLQITQFIRQLQSFVDDFGSLLQGLISFALAPLDIIENMRGLLTQVRLTSLDLMRTVSNIHSATGGLGPAALGLTVFTETLALMKETRNTAANLAQGSVETLDELSRIDLSDLLAVFTAPAGITLRDVSNRFYGTPDGWRVIQRRNGLFGSTVPRGTVLQIPQFG